MKLRSGNYLTLWAIDRATETLIKIPRDYATRLRFNERMREGELVPVDMAKNDIAEFVALSDNVESFHLTLEDKYHEHDELDHADIKRKILKVIKDTPDIPRKWYFYLVAEEFTDNHKEFLQGQLSVDRCEDLCDELLCHSLERWLKISFLEAYQEMITKFYEIAPKYYPDIAGE